jgi:transcription antitermination factor NusG
VLSVIHRQTLESESVASAEPLRSNHSWYALQVRSNFENLASATLRGKGYEEFLPLYRSRRRWSDRIKELDLPLFPGYLFCRFDADNRLPILTTPGVIAIVGAGKTPVAVSDEEIGAVQAIIRSGLPAQPWPCLTVGSRIFIERGPLAGVEGIALNVEKKYRLVVSVPLLQRSVAVEIAREWARPILNGSEPRPPPAPASFRNTGLSNRTNRNPPAWSRAICRTTPVDRK